MPRRIWKRIPSHPNYEASNDGRIRRAEPGRNAVVGRELARRLNRHGHVVVSLSEGAFLLHRLVAEAFLGPSDDPVVRHLDDIPSNNRIENLAYGTQRENVQDRYRNELRRYLLQR